MTIVSKFKISCLHRVKGYNLENKFKKMGLRANGNKHFFKWKEQKFEVIVYRQL